jgi:hemerythrin superfamily protein
MQDVVDLIMADHREVERLFEVLKNQPDERALQLPILSSLLIAHSRAEESEVYPAAKAEAGEDDEVAHSQQEHAEAEQLLEALQGVEPTSKEFDLGLQKLVKAVTHHVEEEESDVLPGLRERLSVSRRAELAEAFAATREEHLGDRPGEATRDELMEQAKNAGISGASAMTKQELTHALRQ